MSCLVTPEMQYDLRQYIVRGLLDKSAAGQPIVLKDYINEIYNFFKEQGADEAMALDAARLTPTLVDQILAISTTVAKIVKERNPRLRSEALDFIDSFDADLNNVRDALGLRENVAEQLEEAQAKVDNIDTQEVYEAFEESEDVVLEDKDTDTKHVDYALQKPDGKLPSHITTQTSLVAIGSIIKMLVSQIQEQNINDSSELVLRTKEGSKTPARVKGVYGRIMRWDALKKAYPDYNMNALQHKDKYADTTFVVIATDINGVPLKFRDGA